MRGSSAIHRQISQSFWKFGQARYSWKMDVKCNCVYVTLPSISLEIVLLSVNSRQQLMSCWMLSSFVCTIACTDMMSCVLDTGVLVSEVLYNLRSNLYFRQALM